MKELFKKQLETNNVVTEVILDKIKIKKYKNGDDIKVGDKVLYALFINMSEETIKAKPFSLDEPVVEDEELNSLSLELDTLNESQFDLYACDEIFQNQTNQNGLPIIRLK